MFGEIPCDLVFDDEPLDALLYNTGPNGVPAPSPADALAVWAGSDPPSADWQEAALAILRRDPAAGRGIAAPSLLRRIEAEAQALERSGTGDPDSVLLLANLWRAAGRDDRAEATYRRALVGRDGPAALSPDQRAQVLGRLIELLDAQGRQPEAREQQRLCEAQRLLQGEEPDALVGVRGIALALFAEGRHEAAEGLYRALLARRFEVPGTWVHLARVLLMQDRIPEARQAVAAAWRCLTGGEAGGAAPLYVRHRVLYLRLLCAALARRPYRRLAASLRRALECDDERMTWTIGPVLKHLAPHLPRRDRAFLAAVAEAVDQAQGLRKAQTFAAWTDPQAAEFDPDEDVGEPGD